MSNLNEQINEAGKRGVDTALKLANLSMETAERLIRLQLDAAKAYVSEHTENAKALTTVGDGESMRTMHGRLAQQTMERALGYSRSVYEIAAQTQHEIARVMEERFNTVHQEMQDIVIEMFKNAPGGTEPARQAIQAAFTSSQSVFDTMSKAAKQASEAAEANVKAIMSAAEANRVQ